ncbi:hypothetical protein [Mycolicibacterium goodii]|uniref:hypothetical protein n=1 Tax=Mycolicibacterium goodii TaxID=134601 RepID=UPI001BDD40AD|nr:hypothetical protein [Mycolicibacterium goodii]MBU8834407.1 hypothetical protein [Mycolicibacterium goodii]
MAGDAISPEPRYPLGDAAGLLDYRRSASGMKPIDPRRPFGPIGHTYIAITCSARGFGGGGGSPLAERAKPADPRVSHHRLIAISAALLAVAAYTVLLVAILYRWI